MKKPKMLHNEILELYNSLDDMLLSKYNRSLPLQDVVVDRWDRAKKLNFGEGASVYNSAYIFGEVSVGKQTWIGPNVMLDGSGASLSIGTNCSVSTGVQIYTHDTVLRSLSGGIEPTNKGSVKIGNNCYIGSTSVISAGVTIGNQCVIAANSFVNKDIPSKSIFGGTPAKKIGEVIIKDDKIFLNYEKD